METSNEGSGLDDSLVEYEAEVNSVYNPGSKKQNLNHYLNFSYGDPHGSVNSHNRRGYNRGGYIKKIKYNKEQFLQAK